MTQTNKKIFLISVILFCIFFLSSFHTASAATGLAIQPVKITYTLKPGDTVTGNILLTNQSDEAVNVETNVQDFIPTAGSDTFSFVGKAPGVTSVVDWVKLPSKPFIFGKGEQKQIPYTITVPEDAEPGSHFGVAFFKATKVSELNAQLKIGTQVGVLIFITIPGNHQQAGKIIDFSVPSMLQSGPVPFVMHFQNSGTVYFEPQGEITVDNMFGQKVASIPIGGEVVLPTGIKRIVTTWNVTGFLIGYYRATANIKDTEGNVISSLSTGFWVIPVWYIVGFIILLVLIFFVIRFIKRRVKISISLE